MKGSYNKQHFVGRHNLKHVLPIHASTGAFASKIMQKVCKLNSNILIPSHYLIERAYLISLSVNLWGTYCSNENEFKVRLQCTVNVSVSNQWLKIHDPLFDECRPLFKNLTPVIMFTEIAPSSIHHCFFN